MLYVRRLLAVFACFGVLTLPAAAIAQEERRGNGEEEPLTEPAGRQLPQEKPGTEQGGEPEEQPAEEPREEPAAGPEARPDAAPADKRARQATAPPPDMQENWITLSGTVADSDPASFTLDYGDGLILVDMQDWDWYGETTRLMPGERVKLTARIDDDLYQNRILHPDMVFAVDRQSFYFSGATDKLADVVPRSDPADLPEGTWISVSGIVKQVDGREFVLDTGIHDIEVDTDELGYNPLDDVGLQRIQEGDRIYVSGPLDDQFFEENEILAQTVISLTPAYTLE